ncbi:hypothetical protein K493DRAFT_344265 [Basidiobolus meristosporus CBS 931.73]|uniref:Uncharacterized protein n=1 Tax=Basidiobolus meristosporus CBS 931.73 TaxID=1314790 RepID=A0A1Y1Z957_9FUNG|nr:hypothetical protein K493DRAFT_344265 [Basidiobolus meristosporus CBS 931.73]|eukprot:ORY06803.1 hypothetical protein K493DRAFT_344265 [Basidiobolus meristosporus CBS 931.73]
MASVESKRNSLYGMSGSMGALNDLIPSPRTKPRTLGNLADPGNPVYSHSNPDAYSSNDLTGRTDGGGSVPTNYYHSNEPHGVSSAEHPREDTLASALKRNSAFSSIKGDSRAYGSPSMYNENRKSYPVEPGYMPDMYGNVQKMHYSNTASMDAHTNSILSALTSDSGYHPSQVASELTNQPAMEPPVHGFQEGFPQQFTPRNKRQGLYMDTLYSSAGGSSKRGEYSGNSMAEHERIPKDFNRQVNRRSEHDFEETVGNQLDNLSMNERRNHRRGSYDLALAGRNDVLSTTTRASDVYHDTIYESGHNYNAPYGGNHHYRSPRSSVYNQDEYGTSQPLYKGHADSLKSGGPDADISSPRYRTLYQETLASSGVGPTQSSRLDAFQQQASHQYLPRQGSPLSRSPRVNGIMTGPDEAIYESRYSATEPNQGFRGPGNECINREILEQFHPYVSQRERTEHKQYYSQLDATKFAPNNGVDDYAGNRFSRQVLTSRTSSPSNHLGENVPLERSSYYALDPNPLNLTKDGSERNQ